MPTTLLNKENEFRANVTATMDSVTFLIKGGSAECLVYMPPGTHLATKEGSSAGSPVTVNGVMVGQLIQVQINPSNSKLGNATVTY